MENSVNNMSYGENYKTEEQLQAACFQWFDGKYPQLRGTLFAVPNGGERVGYAGNRLKATGVVAGVSDLILVLPLEVMFIEMKIGSGKQSESQVRFQRMVEKMGHTYHILYSLRTFQEFITTTINTYYAKQ